MVPPDRTREDTPKQDNGYRLLPIPWTGPGGSNYATGSKPLVVMQKDCLVRKLFYNGCLRDFFFSLVRSWCLKNNYIFLTDNHCKTTNHSELDILPAW